MFTCSVEKVPNRNHSGVRLRGDVPTDLIHRICSGLAGQRHGNFLVTISVGLHSDCIFFKLKVLWKHNFSSANEVKQLVSGGGYYKKIIGSFKLMTTTDE